MGSLSNLYISQSYISLLHLGSDNTASSTPTEIQDGLGNGIGITVNTTGDVALGGILSLKKGLDITGSVKINTAVTASTQQFVNSGNQFTDNIIRITGSYDSGSTENPSVYQIQNGWKCYGPGLGNDGATVIANDYVPATGWRFTIDKNTAVWFGLYNFTDPNVQYYNFAVSGSEDITGSLWVRDTLEVNDISASGNISASNLWIKDKIHAYEMDVTIISSSIVFSSGSNIIGDNANQDVQTLIGRVIVTGSLEVTSSIKATNDISSSTLNGIGNVTLYSQSVDNRLDLLENFSASQYKNDSSSFDFRIDNLENFSSSLQATFATQAELNLSSSQLQSNIDTKLNTSSFNAFSISVDSRLDIEEFKSTTFATTGSNTFIGTEIISGSLEVTGSMVYSGSVRGVVVPLTITSQTASLDCSKGNFFTITLVSSADTHLVSTNIKPGLTISLKVKQPSDGYGTLTYNNTYKFSQFFPYSATPAVNAEDILSMQSYDTASLYTVAINKLQ